jgi:hypothetical protein|tara:strand:- start:327 stop:737 length:411 start_codon:yes stop_codon:yes gene_type:complete
MNKNTYVCLDCNDSFKEGWATISHNDELHTFCCYPCYQSNPILVPTKAVFKSTGREKVVQPICKQIEVSPFIFLTETEITDLSPTDYIKYNEEVDNQFLLNPIQMEVHYTNIRNDMHTKTIEDQFTSSSDDDIDDY